MARFLASHPARGRSDLCKALSRDAAVAELRSPRFCGCEGCLVLFEMSSAFCSATAAKDADHEPIRLGHIDTVRVHTEGTAYRNEDALPIPLKNSLLKNLPADVISRLMLHHVTFEQEHEIEFPGKAIQNLYFVEEGMASMTTTFKDGDQVEVTMFGHESVIGISALMGTKQSLNRVYTQIPGYGYGCPIENAKDEFRRGDIFQALALRYVQAQLIQSLQSSGCNLKHNVQQRLARWLLLCADRTHTDTFHLSQEFMAEMLGITRPTVTTAAGLLKEKNIVEYRRGQVHILDMAALQAESCECYQVIKDHLDNYTEFDSGIVA